MINSTNSVVLVSLTLGAAVLRASSISLFVDAPTVQSSSVPGITTEIFDELAPGDYFTSVGTDIGTYQGTPTTPFAIIQADQYGGSGETGSYFRTPEERP